MSYPTEKPVALDGSYESDDSDDSEAEHKLFECLLKHAKKNDLPIEVGTIKVYKGGAVKKSTQNTTDAKPLEDISMTELQDAVQSTASSTCEPTPQLPSIPRHLPNMTHTRMGTAFDGPFEMLKSTSSSSSSSPSSSTFAHVSHTLTQVMAYGSINAFNVTSLLVDVHSPLIRGTCALCETSFESLEQAILPHGKCTECHKRICLTCALKRSGQETIPFCCQKCKSVEP